MSLELLNPKLIDHYQGYFRDRDASFVGFNTFPNLKSYEIY